MNFFRRHSVLRTLLALLLILQVALAVLMAAWNPLHEKLHDCCEHDEPHHCEVALFAQGSVPLIGPPVAAPAPLAAILPAEHRKQQAANSLVTAGHLIGGVLAQSPPRGP
ncbi:MAG: hypothetical protein V4733_10995 [Verrucomicrobiota bacterium]